MKLSVILPAYNEEQIIEKTKTVLTNILRIEQIDYELIFVDDGSIDITWPLIEKMCEEDLRVVGVHFSRNFGKESAIFAGLANALGDSCVVMDCDLQHPPETVIEMYRLWEQGYEVVEGIKTTRGKESLLHKVSAGLFYKIISSVIRIDMTKASDFKLMDRKVVNALLAMPEKNVFFRALSSWVGFKSTVVEFAVREREAGESKWSVLSLIKYALTNIAAFSAAPMQLVTFVGVFTLIFALILGIQTLTNFWKRQAAEDFTVVILLVLFLGGIVMVSLGIIGYYISKIYEEVKGRPKYLISKVLRKRMD